MSSPDHPDPAVGTALGFGDVILHGLSSFGFVARGLIQEVANGDPRALKMFGVRFTSPVRPGDELETQAWEVGPGPNGTTEIAFITKDITSGKVSVFVHLAIPYLIVNDPQVVLGNGVAIIKKAGKSKL